MVGEDVGFRKNLFSAGREALQSPSNFQRGLRCARMGSRTTERDAVVADLRAQLAAAASAPSTRAPACLGAAPHFFMGLW